MKVSVEAIFNLSDRLCDLPDIAISCQGHESRIDTVAGRSQRRGVGGGRALVACVDDITSAAGVDCAISTNRATSIHSTSGLLALPIAGKNAGIVLLGQRQ